MTLKEKINELRKAKEEDKLVIFVGAGVSKNSGIPDWTELVRRFAEKLHYDNCKKCWYRPNCQISDCKYKYNFCQDEYLKIPQYFYNADKSEKVHYYEIIKETLNIADANPNLINSIIMDLYPKHIITTNFDKLIESTQNPNLMMYKVITNDKELLTKISNNYIIKMHGDIDDLKNIVLKESDYLTYQQNHILIEAFIKKLLMDHTFLFVGYSLNDYNLKLIMGWIENIAKSYGVKGKQRPKNFIISDMDTDDKYSETYFLKNNLFIISTSGLPEKLREKNSTVDLNSLGKDVYTVLDYISDSNNDFRVEPLVDVLFDRYQIFKNLKRISFEDLISLCPFRNPGLRNYNTVHINQSLLFYDGSWFKSLSEILSADNKKANFVKEVLVKAGIEEIQYGNDHQTVYTTSKEQNIYCKLIELEQSNNYMEVLSMANSMNDKMVKAYYSYITDSGSENFMSYMEEVGQSMNPEDYFRLLVFKYNMMIIKKNEEEKLNFERILNNIPKSYKAICLYLRKLYEGNYENINKCNQLADKCEGTIHLGGIQNDDLSKLQAIAYDYYYYFKINNLMLDHFVDPNVFLEPYIRAMLCTYKLKKVGVVGELLGFGPIFSEDYKLNPTDFDIIIKHSELKKLKSFISDFDIRKLNFEEGIKIEDRFSNLCNSISVFPNRFLLVYLNNFLFVLTKCKLDNLKLGDILNSTYDLLFKESELREKILSDIFDELIIFLRYFKNENLADFTKILSGFLDIDIIDYSKNNSLEIERIYKLLAKYSNRKIQEKVSALIDNVEEINEKIRIIYCLSALFTEHQKSTYMKFVKDSLNQVRCDYLYYFLKDKYLEYDEEIEKRFYNVLHGYAKKKNEKPTARTYPDMFIETVNYLILLYLSNRIEIEDLEKFSCFSRYSDTLYFLLKPDDFDYSKFKSENYIWRNFMRDKKYREIIMKHKSEILKDLKKAVDNGYATESQKILFYKYFLTEEDISNYL